MGSEGVAGTNGQPGRKVFVFPLLPVCFSFQTKLFD